MNLEVEIRFIRLREVLHRTSIPKSTLLAMVEEKEFPGCVKLSTRSRAWIESEVQTWMNDKINERDQEKE